LKRSTITNSLEIINDTIVNCDVVDLLESIASGRPKSQDLTKAFSTFEQLTVERHSWSNDTLRVSKIVGVEKIFESESWQSIISKPTTQKAETAGLLLKESNRFLDFMPVLKSLLELDQSSPKNSEVLSLILLDSTNSSSIVRAERLLSSVRDVGRIYEIVHNTTLDNLTLIACDSGSDKEFIFGIPKSAYKFFKDFFLSSWQRFVFHKELKAEKRLDVVAKSLPLLAEVNSKRESLGEENTILLEKMIIETATGILESGVVLAETAEKQEDVRLLEEQTILKIEDKSDQLDG